MTYIEDATGSVNDGDTYEMPGLDIVDFVGCVLDCRGKSRSYTSMSSKRECNSRFVVVKGTIK